MVDEMFIVPSVEDLKRWYTPKEVRDRAVAQKGEAFAEEAVWDRIRDGLIRTCASSMSQRKDYETAIIQRTPWSILHSVWNLYKDTPERFWTGDARFAHDEVVESGDPRYDTAMQAYGYRVSGSTIHISAFGIRLHPDDVDREFPPLSVAVTPIHSIAPAPDPSRGGRPRYDWWEDVWATVAARLASGWKPKLQKELEIEMKTVAEKYRSDVGKTAIRERAKKLAVALEITVEN